MEVCMGEARGCVGLKDGNVNTAIDYLDCLRVYLCRKLLLHSCF